MTPTKYECVVAFILSSTFVVALLITFLGWLFPKTEDDSTDPYIRDYSGVDAPREKTNAR